MLTHLFTPEQCAQCKLCCNFHRSSAWETPALDAALVASLQHAGVPLEQRADGSCSFRLTFHTTLPEETANCPMLDTRSGCTLPREQRPFECRIWPLRLMRTHSGHLALGLYAHCPALTPPVRSALVREATSTLLPVLLEQAKRFPLIIRPIDPAYTIIWQES